MKVNIKIFPIAGLSEQRREMEIALEENGGMGELLARLQEQLDVNLQKIEALMFLHNGRGMDKSENVIFQDGDQLWLLPQISGG